MSDEVLSREPPRAGVGSAEAGRNDAGAPGGVAPREKLTALVLDSISEGFFILDREWRFVFANPAAERFVQKSRTEVLGLSIWEVFPEAANRRFGLEYRRAVAENVPVHFEEFYPEPLNAWYEVRAYPSPDGLSVFFFDVSQRKSVDEALRERVKEMNCLYAIGDLIDRQGDLEQILQGTAQRMPHGWCHSDIACAQITLDGHDVKTANFHETAWRQAAEIVVHGRPAGTVELRYLEERPRRDEGPFLREERSLINEIAERLGRVVERLQAEAALRESEERHRTILLTALDGFWLVDLHGRLLEVNEAYCRMSGYSSQELLAMRIPDLEAVETPAEIAARIQTLMARGEERFESRHRRKDGSTFDVEVGVKYWSAGDGQFIVFLRDVSERKLAERQIERARDDALAKQRHLEDLSAALSESEAAVQRANGELEISNDALRRNNELLEARVAERTSDLAHRTEQLRALALDLTRAEELERKRVAEVIHDHLQQLLSVARINVGMALERAGTKALQQSLAEVDDLIGKALDVTRTLTAELNPAILHRSGLAAALRWLGRSYKDRFGLDVDVHADQEPDVDEEQRAMLFRAARELLFNVVKHAGVASARVRLSQTPDGRARIVVSDRGVGLDPETLRGRDGTGEKFGLFSLRERLALLGGLFEVDSAPQEGASFTVTGPPPRRVVPGASGTPPVAPLAIAVRRLTGVRRGPAASRKKR